MSNEIFLHRRSHFLVAALLTACWIGVQEQAAAGQFLGIGGNKAVAYRTYRDSAGRFDIDFPTKDWRTLPNTGTSLAGFARNDGSATLAIDLTRLARPMPSADIAYTTMAEVEIQELKARSPQAKDFTSELVDLKAGRGALIRYVQAGSKGPERVIQYSVPIGQDLYRVIAIVPEKEASKHEPVLLHMIQSLKAPAGTADPKG